MDRLESGEVISDLTTCCYGVATGVWKEYSREKRKMRATVDLDDILSVPVPLKRVIMRDGINALSCVCKKLSRKDHELILKYHEETKSAKIAHHKTLAKEQEISVNALRVKVFRIRQTLQHCIIRCMEEKAQE
jgi:hypothetical protein